MKRRGAGKRRQSKKCNATASGSRKRNVTLASHARVSVYQLGTVDRIDYTRGKQHRFHVFKGKSGAKVYATHDGKQLIIAPVKVARNEIQD